MLCVTGAAIAAARKHHPLETESIVLKGRTILGAVASVTIMAGSALGAGQAMAAGTGPHAAPAGHATVQPARTREAGKTAGTRSDVKGRVKVKPAYVTRIGYTVDVAGTPTSVPVGPSGEAGRSPHGESHEHGITSASTHLGGSLGTAKTSTHVAASSRLRDTHTADTTRTPAHAGAILHKATAIETADKMRGTKATATAADHAKAATTMAKADMTKRA
jgi:hypothetical protein